MKTPDCVKWQHEGGDRIYEATKDLSREELIAWWEERNREFVEWMAELREDQLLADHAPLVRH
ncbi:MAG: hypothetical protein FJX75_22075 [Armatimonadetes bacterium]|nr:hypothetical protein [Armatimonadota bacterium]